MALEVGPWPPGVVQTLTRAANELVATGTVAELGALRAQLRVIATAVWPDAVVEDRHDLVEHVLASKTWVFPPPPPGLAAPTRTAPTRPATTTLLASAGEDGTIRLWDPATGQPIGHPLTGHDGSVRSVAFGTLPEGRVILASGSRDKTVRLWDPVTGQSICRPLTGHKDEVAGVAFGALPDRRVILASCSWDKTVRLWDPVTGQPIRRPLTGHEFWVRSVAFGRLSDGRRLLAAAGLAEVRLWDPATGRPVGRDLPAVGLTEVRFGTLPDGRVILASGNLDGSVLLWDPVTGQPIGDPLTGHIGPVGSMAFGRLRDGRVILATGSIDCTVRLWDPRTGQPIGPPINGRQMIYFLRHLVHSVALGTLPDGRVILASGGGDEAVRLWDPATGQPIGHPLTGHDGGVWSVAFGTLPVSATSGETTHDA